MKDEINNSGLKAIILGDGDKVVKQYPKKNTELIKSSKVFILTNSKEIKMPNITGFTRTDLINIANILGIKYKISGKGSIITTNLAEGTIINKDTTLEIKLTEKEVQNEEKKETKPSE